MQYPQATPRTSPPFSTWNLPPLEDLFDAPGCLNICVVPQLGKDDCTLPLGLLLLTQKIWIEKQEDLFLMWGGYAAHVAKLLRSSTNLKGASSAIK